MDNVYLKDFSIDIHKKRKPNHYLLLLETCPDLEVIQFWFVKNICQVCKLIFLFWTFFGNIDIDIFPFVALLKIFYNSSGSLYITNLYLWYFLETAEALWTQHFWKSFYSYVYLSRKKKKSSKTYSRKTSITRDPLVVESCQTLVVWHFIYSMNQFAKHPLLWITWLWAKVSSYFFAEKVSHLISRKVSVIFQFLKDGVIVINFLDLLKVIELLLWNWKER